MLQQVTGAHQFHCPFLVNVSHNLLIGNVLIDRTKSHLFDVLDLRYTNLIEETHSFGEQQPYFFLFMEEERGERESFGVDDLMTLLSKTSSHEVED